jgi:hypothetical protein
MGKGGQPKMLEPVTTSAARTDIRLAYQYTDAFSFPSSNLLIPINSRSHFGFLETGCWLVPVLSCQGE